MERCSKNFCRRSVSSLILRFVSTERFSLNSRYDVIASTTEIFGAAALRPASISSARCAATVQLRVLRVFGLTAVPSGNVPVIQIGHFNLPGQFGSAFEVSEHRFSCLR